MNEYIEESIKAISSIDTNRIKEIATIIIERIKAGNKILIAGNGGSAADAQHFAGELLSKYNINRRPLPAIALTTDTSVLTAIANDYGYEQVFERQIRALGNVGDVFIGISTSGKSKNIIKAFEVAEGLNMITIGFTGISDLGSDLLLKVDSDKTPLIQQAHIVAIHMICGLVEQAFKGRIMAYLCPICNKSSRAKSYCHRSDCGLVAMQTVSSPIYFRYNQILEVIKLNTSIIEELANQAYALAQSESSPGPKNTLLNIADKASQFASLVKASNLLL